MSIALGALRNRTQLPDGSLVPVDEPARQADAHRRDRARVHLERHRLRADAQRLHRSTTSPTRPTRAAATASACRSRAGTTRSTSPALAARLLRARSAPIPSADIIGWKTLTDTGGPFDANPAATGDGRRAHGQPLRATTSTTASRPRPRCWPTAGTTTSSRSTSRCATTTRSARSTRTRRSRCSTSTSATARAPAPISAADRAALTAAENAWLDYYVKGVGSEPADARGGVDILTSKCPVSGAGTRYHAPTWAQLAPGEIRLDGAAAQTIVAPGTAPSNAFTSGDVCTTTSSADNASRRDLQGPGGDDGLHARGLADDRRQARRQRRQRHGRRAALRRRRRDPAADRPRRPAPARRRARARPSRSSSCTRRPGPSSPATCSSSSCSPRTRSTCARRPPRAAVDRRVSDLQLRLPVVDAPGTRPRHGVTRAAPAAKFVPAGDKLAREYATEADGSVGRHRRPPRSR